ncbi:hypothetical protein GCM10018793_37450 [Streptomyces sulfonofaciens]|uniref:Uncharacterized protein n=1 Tax=Streptomyces sulfonofaciens TaxID=68272 RepID=A0A919GAA3_9ACTN|nr:hypothetical protein [Streptomyces sulfonofaciens]GHH80987.1 hypothetical protein GCM10018793_37450 [Streptomyces sulfonofaciens]
MTTPNGGQQGAAQAFGNLLGQSMPFSAQSAGGPQPQGATAPGPQQLDPQFLPVLAALAPVLVKTVESIISNLSAQQGAPQGVQQPGVSPQFLPGLPFPPVPSPVDLLRGIGGLFGLNAPQGTPQTAVPQAATGGQQQLDPQFIPFLAALVPGLISAAPDIIKGVEGLINSLSAQQGAPQGVQQPGVSPQFLPGLPFPPVPSPVDLLRGIGGLFGLNAPQGTPQTAQAYTGGFGPGQPMAAAGGRQV